ncbi:uncharacterized protein LOC121040989 [Herpailurus yagouaroundi]|uniref:uncharacterized protein LOC121040989 n=1 Tax=Herpailurus yagouaroundi TaxID=1608482 RepID=UPI001AD719D3|nr:uncharacterized protein LOC121040989 [Puma yagouaroundi]
MKSGSFLLSLPAFGAQRLRVEIRAFLAGQRRETGSCLPEKPCTNHRVQARALIGLLETEPHVLNPSSARSLWFQRLFEDQRNKELLKEQRNSREGIALNVVVSCGRRGVGEQLWRRHSGGRARSPTPVAELGGRVLQRHRAASCPVITHFLLDRQLEPRLQTDISQRLRGRPCRFLDFPQAFPRPSAAKCGLPPDLHFLP